MKRDFTKPVLIFSLLIISITPFPTDAQNLPPGDFTKTCKNFSVLGPILMGQCQKRNGEWAATRIDYRDCDYVVNDNGNLKCDRWKPAKLPKGSYKGTCKDIRVDGKYLKADCRRKDGAWKYSDINYKDCDGDIFNDDGRLKCNQSQKLPKGSYKQSCRDIRVDGKYLKAECRKRDGGWRVSEINWKNCDHDIANDNGRLTCAGGQSSLPKGSYKQTCRYIRVDGKQLKAQCKKTDGGWRDTDINWKNCSGDIYNDNGRLKCN